MLMMIIIILQHWIENTCQCSLEWDWNKRSLLVSMSINNLLYGYAIVFIWFDIWFDCFSFFYYVSIWVFCRDHGTIHDNSIFFLFYWIDKLIEHRQKYEQILFLNILKTKAIGTFEEIEWRRQKKWT